MNVLLFLIVPALAGMLLWGFYLGRQRSKRLYHALKTLEKRYERLVDQEVGLRWNNYEAYPSLDEKIEQISSNILATLKPNIDQLIYLINQADYTEALENGELRYFTNTVELLNMHIRKSKTLTTAEREEFERSCYYAIRSHLREKLLYLEGE